MPEPLHVCALVPAKDEAATIAATVRALLSISEVAQVLVIDDGSSDDTADLARAAGASVLRFPYNQGQAQAIMAGARAITDTDIFLIVDGDVGESAVHARALLMPVLDDEADVTIAVLPAGVTGGFGMVKRTAQWGVRRATGLHLKAPISGQRALRADLLRSMQPSGHFGFSISLSIDAHRMGARTLEVDVPLTHRHTGKSLAGFVHRGKQGFFLLRALWPRLTSSRFRIGLAFVLLVGILGALVISGTNNAKVAGTVQPPAKKVVIFGMPGLTWDEMRTDTPNLEALAADGSVGDLMVKTQSTTATTQEAYASLGAGNPLRATLLTALALPRDAAFEADTAADALARRTGERPTGAIAVMGAAELQLLNDGKHLSTGPGTLGDALAKADLRTAVVGNADIEVSDDGSLQLARRPAGAAAMTANGSVGGGAVGPQLLTDDPDFAYGRRADPDRMLEAFDRAQAGADVVVVDPGDLDRADEQRHTFLPDQAAASRTRALKATDEILGRIADQIDSDTLLIVTGLRPPRSAGWRLAPVIVHGPGVPHGYVNSPGTHRPGVATLFDIAPSVLHALGADVPADLPGSAVKYQATNPDIQRLEDLDRDAAFRSQIFTPVTTTFVVVQGVLYALIALLLVLQLTNRWMHPLRWIVLAVLAYPPATFLYRAIPDVAALGSTGLILLLVIDVALVWLSLKTGKNPLAPAVLLIGLTVVILVVDVATGNQLQLSSLLGLSLNSAGRYYGYGNISLALLAAGSIMLTVILLDASTSKREVAIVGSMFLVFILIVDGAPTLGNDIGGILTLAPVFTVVIARLLGLRLTWKTVIVGGLMAVGALVLAGAADVLRSGDSHGHFGKLIDSVRNEGWSPLTDTILRKLGALGRLVQNSVWTRLIPICTAYLAFVLLWRERWRRLFERRPVLRLGIIASLSAGLLGSLVNDSGPIVMALVLSVVCPIVSLMVLQSERDEEPFLLEPTVPSVPAVA